MKTVDRKEIEKNLKLSDTTNKQFIKHLILDIFVENITSNTNKYSIQNVQTQQLKDGKSYRTSIIIKLHQKLDDKQINQIVSDTVPKILEDIHYTPFSRKNLITGAAGIKGETLFWVYIKGEYRILVEKNINEPDLISITVEHPGGETTDGKLYAAYQMLESIEEPAIRAKYTARVICKDTTLNKDEKEEALERAIELATTSRDKWTSADAILDIGKTIIDEGFKGIIFSAQLKISSGYEAYRLMLIGHKYIAQKVRNSNEEFVRNELLEILKNAKRPDFFIDKALSKIANECATRGWISDAEFFLKQMSGDNKYWIICTKSNIWGWAKKYGIIGYEGYLQDSYYSIKDIEKQYWRDKSRVGMIRKLINSDNSHYAAKIIEDIESEYWKARVLVETVFDFSKNENEMESTMKNINDIISSPTVDAKSENPPNWQDKIKRCIVKKYSEKEEWNRALEVIVSINSSSEINRAWAEYASIAASKNQIDRSKFALNMITDRNKPLRYKIIGEIAVAMISVAQKQDS